MPSPLPRRTLADWTPEAGDVTEWLARWEAAGWRARRPDRRCEVNPFTLVSARVRLWLYGVAGFSGLGLGAVTAYCEAVALPRPTWVVGASAALAVLAAPLFALAASNVVPQVTVAADPPSKVTVEPLDPIVSSEGVTYPQSSDTKADSAHYDAKHDVD